MDRSKLWQLWQSEYRHAFEGWDFSHIDGRWETDEIPWDYTATVRERLKPSDSLLDMGTGGGELLLSLGHTCAQTAVTEAYPPNVELCRRKLEPKGVTVAQVYDDGKLPFDDGAFDIVINRHSAFDLREVGRVLRCGGYFIMQQVGAQNNRELSEKLIEGFVPKFDGHEPGRYCTEARSLGFEVEKVDECFPEVRFFDVGALVYYAKIIEWEFPGFDVERCFERLIECKHEIDRRGYIGGRAHRFILAARKKRAL